MRKVRRVDLGLRVWRGRAVCISLTKRPAKVEAAVDGGNRHELRNSQLWHQVAAAAHLVTLRAGGGGREGGPPARSAEDAAEPSPDDLSEEMSSQVRV